MQTDISDLYRDTSAGREADSILRTCVHCGFCTATCPTYQLLGDELDGPRGRIYLIKQVLEGGQVSAHTQSHLDRCLTCRSCETTCPSGVRYGRLLDIGREIVEQAVARSAWDRFRRRLLRYILPYPRRFARVLRLAHLLRPLLPGALRKKLPPQSVVSRWQPQSHARKMLLAQGCVQSVATPQTNLALAQLLDKLGIETVSAESAGCCGAVSHHLAAAEEALDFMRRNIDAWWPHVEAGAEAIISTASGCGVMLKDYGHLLQHDAAYAAKAAQVSALSRDISEVLAQERLPPDRLRLPCRKIAFHSPCTLQHGQQLRGVVESILTTAGFSLLPVADAHLCCGSAGTYSLLQPALSQQLLENKVKALQEHEPELIVSANVGCQLHLSSRSRQPVKHWVELLNDSIK